MTAGRKPGYKHSKETRSKISKARQSHGVDCAISAFRGGDKFLDKRTAVGRAIYEVCDSIQAECGELSQRQRTIIDLLRSKLGIIHLVAKDLILKGELTDKQWLLKLFLQYSESVARDMERLPKLSKSRAGGLDYEGYMKLLKSANKEGEQTE